MQQSTSNVTVGVSSRSQGISQNLYFRNKKNARKDALLKHAIYLLNFSD